MTVLVCSTLFPLDDVRTESGVTHAVRRLVEDAREQGLPVRQVVRFLPLLDGGRLHRPRATRCGGLQVLDVPRIGTRRHFSATLTRLALAAAGGLDPPGIVACHMLGSFATARRVLAATRARFALVLHAADLRDPRLGEALVAADAVFCRSEAVRRRLAEATGFQAHGVVSSGVPESDFGTPDRPLAGTQLRLVVAATLLPLKNIPATLRALELLPPGLDVRLDIYGDGPQRAELEALVARPALRDRVVLHGFRPRAEVLQAMRAAHLFVMPSAPETFGLAYLEAMAQGCVPIGHAGWGIDGVVVDGGNGYLVPRADPAGIAGRIEAYLRSDRAAMHRQAFATATAHGARAAAANYAALVGSVGR